MTHNPLMSRERVVVPPRPQPTKAMKIAAWNRVGGICWWCGKPVAAAGEDVRWDHDSPRGISADDSAENLCPLHVKCHSEKTNGPDGDIAKVAHVKRQERLTRPKERKRGGFRGWRKMNGEIVWRDGK